MPTDLGQKNAEVALYAHTKKDQDTNHSFKELTDSNSNMYNTNVWLQKLNQWLQLEDKSKITSESGLHSQMKKYKQIKKIKIQKKV